MNNDYILLDLNIFNEGVNFIMLLISNILLSSSINIIFYYLDLIILNWENYIIPNLFNLWDYLLSIIFIVSGIYILKGF